MPKSPSTRSTGAGRLIKPGLGWSERFLGGSEAYERAYILQAMEDIQEVQRRNKQASGAKRFARAFHAKTLAGTTNASFHVMDDIPTWLQVGWLRPGNIRSARVRFSNASGMIRSDKKKDLRGIAVDVDTEYGAHHFLATNGIVSHARDVLQFIEFAKAMSGSKALILPRLIANVGLFEAVRMFRTVIGQASKPIESLATETYFSRSPFAFGDYALKFQFVPNDNRPLARKEDSDEFLSEDLIGQLLLGSVVFDFQVQLFDSEATTPIEDGSVQWSTTPFTIGRLILPPQNLLGDSNWKSIVEAIEYNPWTVPEGFRPLGSLNRGRRCVYPSSADFRLGR